MKKKREKFRDFLGEQSNSQVPHLWELFLISYTHQSCAFSKSIHVIAKSLTANQPKMQTYIIPGPETLSVADARLSVVFL